MLDSESFLVDEYIRVLGKVSQDRGYGSSVPHFSIWLFMSYVLYNKPVIVSKSLS